MRANKPATPFVRRRNVTTRARFVGVCVLAVALVPLGASAGAKEPPSGDPELIVVPGTDLVNAQEVRVRGVGFPPGVQVGIVQCVAGATYHDDCDFNTALYDVTGDGGKLRTPAVVHRFIRVAKGAVDCAKRRGACVMAARNLDDHTQPPVFGQLEFDPDAPLPPAPKFGVEPDAQLVDRQMVTARGRRFAPFEEVQIAQCLAGSDPLAFPSSCTAFTYAFTDERGRFSAIVGVRRLVTRRDGKRADCADRLGKCAVIAASYQDPFRSAEAPIGFDPDVPPAPPPTIKVRPRRDLHGGQVLSVTGDGFTPFAQVGIAQCVEGALDVDDCDLGTVTYATPDTEGQFQTTITVRGRLSTVNGEVDCRAEAGACVVGGANLADIAGEQASGGRLTFVPRS
jgi:neocarzinostatin family protein